MGAQLEPLKDVERFLSMLRFDSREKLKDFGLDLETSVYKQVVISSNPRRAKRTFKCLFWFLDLYFWTGTYDSRIFSSSTTFGNRD